MNSLGIHPLPEVFAPVSEPRIRVPKRHLLKMIKQGNFQVKMLDGTEVTDWRIVESLFEIERLPQKIFERRRIKRERIASLRSQVYERDGGKCVECGTSEKLTLDHIIPRSKGGKRVFENLQTMCSTCNNRKGNKLPK